jgi:hypothetical protein
MGDFNSDRGNMIIKHIIENNIFKFVNTINLILYIDLIKS